jgi:hypothetical protein
MRENRSQHLEVEVAFEVWGLEEVYPPSKWQASGFPLDSAQTVDNHPNSIYADYILFTGIS